VYNQPIYTLPVLNSRLYIVNDPALAAAVQRTKTLSFNPIIPNVTQRVLGFDDATAQIIAKGIDRDGAGPRGFYPEMHDMVYGLLSPGDALNDLTLAAVREFAAELDSYMKVLKTPEFSRSGKAEDLLLWVRHIVAIATARFVFGSLNPVARIPQLEEAFWDFDHGIPGLLLGILPQWTARRAFFARESLVRAFVRYLEEDSYLEGCELIRRRVKIAGNHGFTTEAIAREELSFLFAGIVNTAVTSFWMVLHVFARPSLLEQVRDELEGCIDGEGKRKTISVQKVKDKCELLMSIYREVLRFESDTASTRAVTADTILGGQYFLKKDSTLLVSGGTMHQLKSVWGEDVDEFNPRRFIELTRSKELHPAAFRAFGGGSTLCPGRHFATNEILVFVAMILLRFDIKQAAGKELKVPRKQDDVLPVHILEPEDAVEVNIEPRQGWEDSDWETIL
jgi:cytochrome P450